MDRVRRINTNDTDRSDGDVEVLQPPARSNSSIAAEAERVRAQRGAQPMTEAQLRLDPFQVPGYAPPPPNHWSVPPGGAELAAPSGQAAAPATNSTQATAGPASARLVASSGALTLTAPAGGESPTETVTLH